MNDLSQDWHAADIIAALKKRGTSLAELSRQSGLSSSTLSNALVRPWTKGERIIATALELEPETIWPSRYVNKETNLPIKRYTNLSSKKRIRSKKLFNQQRE